VDHQEGGEFDNDEGVWLGLVMCVWRRAGAAVARTLPHARELSEVRRFIAE
jgi:adenine-specific DNA methylase